MLKALRHHPLMVGTAEALVDAVRYVAIVLVVLVLVVLVLVVLVLLRQLAEVAL